MTLLYALALHGYGLALQLAALFNTKAAQWAAGRRHWRKQHRALLEKGPAEGPLLWMHCASLGEFEQGRPVIEQLKQENPRLRILLTFFSPSGYELRKNYAQADYVAYLPLDTAANARDLIKIWQPQLAVFVKYEFWYFHLRELQRTGIPALLISALFRPRQPFFRPYGGFFRRMLGGFRHIFVQNEASAALLEQAGCHHYTVAGDTRVDRVLQIAGNAPAFPLVEQFKGDAPMLIAGSTWPEDEARLLPFINRQLPRDWKAVIAPHQVDEGHVQSIMKKLKLPAIRYSQLQDAKSTGARVLVIDNVGMLSALYQYGRIAYIGGAFGTGLHNTLEPIAFGLPVLFGPHYEKFEEARYLVREGGGFTVHHTEDIRQRFEQLQKAEACREASRVARNYVLVNKGASQKASSYILQLLNKPA